MEVVQRAMGEWLEFKEEQTRNGKGQTRAAWGDRNLSSSTTWQFLETGEVKFNVSSACDGSGGIASIGLIVRDDLGSTLQA